MAKYTIEFTTTVTVEAEDAVQAVEVAQAYVDMENMYIYVDGNLWN